MIKKNPLRKIPTHTLEDGKLGYIIAWFLGVPASVLLLVFLVRGN